MPDIDRRVGDLEVENQIQIQSLLSQGSFVNTSLSLTAEVIQEERVSEIAILVVGRSNFCEVALGQI